MYHILYFGYISKNIKNTVLFYKIGQLDQKASCALMKKKCIAGGMIACAHYKNECGGQVSEISRHLQMIHTK